MSSLSFHVHAWIDDPRIDRTEQRKGFAKDAASECAIDHNHIASPRCRALEGIKRDAVQLLDQSLALGEKLVRKVAVEQDSRMRVQPAEEGDASAQLVHKKGRRVQVAQLRAQKADLEEEVELSQDGAEDGEASQDGGRDEGVAADTNVESACITSVLVVYGQIALQTILRFIEAVSRIAVARENCHFVA